MLGGRLAACYCKQRQTAEQKHVFAFKNAETFRVEFALAAPSSPTALGNAVADRPSRLGKTQQEADADDECRRHVEMRRIPF